MRHILTFITRSKCHPIRHLAIFAKSKDAYKFFTTTILFNQTLKDYAEKIISYSRNVPEIGRAHV